MSLQRPWVPFHCDKLACKEVWERMQNWSKKTSAHKWVLIANNKLWATAHNKGKIRSNFKTGWGERKMVWNLPLKMFFRFTESCSVCGWKIVISNASPLTNGAASPLLVYFWSTNLGILVLWLFPYVILQSVQPLQLTHLSVGNAAGECMFKNQFLSKRCKSLEL